MSLMKWSESEKRIARQVFEAALQRELAEVMAEFKQRASSATEPGDMWSVEQFLKRARTNIDSKYDYRYSQLLFVFGQLLGEGRISEDDLQGLSEEKLDSIRCRASL